MSRPAEKIALLEASLEKKENDIKVLQLATRRLEEELSTLREVVEEGFNAADQKTEVRQLVHLSALALPNTGAPLLRRQIPRTLQRVLMCARTQAADMLVCCRICARRWRIGWT